MNKKYTSYEDWLADTFWGKRAEESEKQDTEYLSFVAPIVETYRYAFLGSGAFHWVYWLVSLGVTALILLFGLVIFNKVEKNFIDTV